MNLMLALAGGLVLALAAILGRELSDRRLRTVEEIGLVIDRPVIGVLPSFKKLQSSSRMNEGVPLLGSSTDRARPRLTASSS
jgi:hypothetical protein